MTPSFRIFDITDWSPASEEQMGSKAKFWVVEPGNADERQWLFKRPRPGHGEDWAEKVAAELAALLGLPHARVELAEFKGGEGALSRSFMPSGRGARLVHGNELLGQFDSDYPTRSQTFALPQHTVDRISVALEHHPIRIPDAPALPPEVDVPLDLFVGYLLLDAWIGNTDRHHENWAAIEVRDGLILAPTYDHGSSLGRNESDARRQERLTTNDANRTVAAYSQRTPSRIYRHENDGRPLHPVDVFRHFAVRARTSARVWLDRLNGISDDQVEDVIRAVPDNRMSVPAREFCLALLSCNRVQLFSEPSP